MAEAAEKGYKLPADVRLLDVEFPVTGKVTMDQTMVDVGHIEGVSVGDEAVLIGRQGDNDVRCEELARVAGTIPYEIVCSITNRVPRIYKDPR